MRVEEHLLLMRMQKCMIDSRCCSFQVVLCEGLHIGLLNGFLYSPLNILIMKQFVFLIAGFLLGSLVIAMKDHRDAAIDSRLNSQALDPVSEGSNVITTYTNQSIYYMDFDSLRISGENEGIIHFFDNQSEMIEWWENFSVRLVYIEDIVRTMDCPEHVWPQGMYWEDINFPLVRWIGSDNTPFEIHINRFDTIAWVYVDQYTDNPLLGKLKVYPVEPNELSEDE